MNEDDAERIRAAMKRHDERLPDGWHGGIGEASRPLSAAGGYYTHWFYSDSGEWEITVYADGQYHTNHVVHLYERRGSDDVSEYPTDRKEYKVLNGGESEQKEAERRAHQMAYIFMDRAANGYYDD